MAAGLFNTTIAIGPRDGAPGYVMSMRDELPFDDGQGSWQLPGTAVPATADTESTSVL